jgi:hypothetical protein
MKTTFIAGSCSQPERLAPGEEDQAHEDPWLK